MPFNPFATLIGLLIPVKISSKLLLKQELKRYDINPYSLPPTLLDDLHEAAFKTYNLLAPSRIDLMNWMVESMEYHATVIASVLAGQADSEYDQNIVRKIKSHLISGKSQ